jgi:hypothetical protein
VVKTISLAKLTAYDYEQLVFEDRDTFEVTDVAKEGQHVFLRTVGWAKWKRYKMPC